jgi:hypothetical protein
MGAMTGGDTDGMKDKKVGKWVVILAVAAFLGAWVYNLGLDGYMQMHPELMYRAEMRKSLEGGKFSELFPNCRPGEMLILDEQSRYYDDMLIPGTWGLYAVRVDSSTAAFSINGKQEPGVIGFVGITAFDSDLDYSEDANSVIEYDSTNGLNSSGDIVYLFHR